MPTWKPNNNLVDGIKTSFDAKRKQCGGGPQYGMKHSAMAILF